MAFLAAVKQESGLVMWDDHKLWKILPGRPRTDLGTRSWIALAIEVHAALLWAKKDASLTDGSGRPKGPFGSLSAETFGRISLGLDRNKQSCILVFLQKETFSAEIGDQFC